MPQRSTFRAVATSTTQPTADTRLWGGGLYLARLTAALAALFGVSTFVVRLPGHFADLQALCTGVKCPYGQLNPEAARSFQVLGLSLGSFAILRISLTILAALIWFTVAAVLAWRKSDDWMALLVAVWCVFEGAATITGTYSLGYTQTPQANQTSAQVVNFVTRVGLFLVFALFPSGRFVPRWSFLLVLAIVAAELPYEFFHNLLSPIGTPLALLIWIGSLVGLVITQIYRYQRVSTPVQRQQTKWAVFGVAIFVVLSVILLWPTVFTPSLGYPGSFFNAIHTSLLIEVGALVPLAIALAILRYRLWDIDVLINKALVAGVLTALLAAMYAGLVIGLESLVGAITGKPGQQPAIIVVSTLAIAILVTPLRRRVQGFIDQRFYRRKYDAARTVAAFGATLRTETDLAALRDQLVAVVEETMQPASVWLWLRPPGQRAPNPLADELPRSSSS